MQAVETERGELIMTTKVYSLEERRARITEEKNRVMAVVAALDEVKRLLRPHFGAPPIPGLYLQIAEVARKLERSLPHSKGKS